MELHASSPFFTPDCRGCGESSSAIESFLYGVNFKVMCFTHCMACTLPGLANHHALSIQPQQQPSGHAHLGPEINPSLGHCWHSVSVFGGGKS